ncbi:MAG: DUF370 domain-containing protein [Catonella sp.]|jgi:hypothetical protein|nr:DUF370 domain-containing protein [Catonella sp.]MDY6357873.1 DUF370 domain-containing protein [Catonella sp.]
MNSLINIGYGNIANAEKITAILSPEAAPVKRMVQHAKDENLAVDATCGRKTRAVLIMDDGHIILSAILPETITARATGNPASAPVHIIRDV